MMSKPQQCEPKLFYHGISLDSRVPQDHSLRRIQQLVDFAFVRSQVEHLYGRNGQVSVDPTVLLKLMFLMFYENIKSERAMMAQLPLRLDWLWFCGYDLDDRTPDHSVLSKARRRWGQKAFSEFFAAILQQCIDAGLVDGTTIHIDSSMIDGNVSKDTLRPQLRLLGQNLYDDLETQSSQTPQEDIPLEQRVSDTDPDARMRSKNGQSTLGYKDHRIVDDQCGIITATLTTPADVNDEHQLQRAIQAHQNNTRTDLQTVVADKAYGIIDNYRYLHDHGLTPCIPHKNPANANEGLFGRDQFQYDADGDCYRCPAGQTLCRIRSNDEVETLIYSIDRTVCQACRYLNQCVKSKTAGRTVNRKAGTEHIEWADACLSQSQRRRLMSRRRFKAEGSFADAANNHGFKRARWRGLMKMTIQNLMIAAIQNLRKLMRYLSRPAVKTAVTLSTCTVLECIRHLFSSWMPTDPLSNQS
ncbi:MAG: transposase [Planctomycetes bacterium]|nr:transposase [Planctomycetota bacterium]